MIGYILKQYVLIKKTLSLEYRVGRTESHWYQLSEYDE